MTDGNGSTGDRSPGDPGPGDRGAAGRELGDELGDRMRTFGRDAQAAGERFGREAQAAGERLARDPGAVAVGTAIGRLWGLVLIIVGLWLLAELSLGLDLPGIDWGLAWPVLLIALGGLVILSAALRRR